MRETGQMSVSGDVEQVPGPIEIPSHSFGRMGIGTGHHGDLKLRTPAKQFRRWKGLFHGIVKPAGIEFHGQVLLPYFFQNIQKPLHRSRRWALVVLFRQIQMTYHIKVIIIQH